MRPRRSWGLLLGVVLAAPVAAADLLDLPVTHAAGPPVALRRIVGDGPAVVAFWATYCGPCRAEVPVLRDAIRRWGSKVRVVAVNVDVEDPARLARAAADWGIDYPSYGVAADAAPRLETLLPEGLPATFFVGPHGIVRHDRLLRAAELEALAHRHLGIESAPGPPPS
jgi:cytochrome c biogenesis protein CcmG/thiol:disulfide interchange protein DsbE